MRNGVAPCLLLLLAQPINAVDGVLTQAFSSIICHLFCYSLAQIKHVVVFLPFPLPVRIVILNAVVGVDRYTRAFKQHHLSLLARGRFVIVLAMHSSHDTMTPNPWDRIL